MLHIAENLKHLRKQKDLTQEEVAEILNVSPQTVSKWERGETYPDITMLPALANFYQTTVDLLIGMDKINDAQAEAALFNKSHELFDRDEYEQVVALMRNALKSFPNHDGIASELAIALAMIGGAENLQEATAICERILAGHDARKLYHTVRAALCVIYLYSGDKEKAYALAQNLPHMRECRDFMLFLFDMESNPDDAGFGNFLTLLATRGDDMSDVIITRTSTPPEEV